MGIRRGVKLWVCAMYINLVHSVLPGAPNDGARLLVEREPLHVHGACRFQGDRGYPDVARRIHSHWKYSLIFGRVEVSYVVVGKEVRQPD